MAVEGLTTPSMAAAINGRSKRKASISHEMSTSSGTRVRRLGTMATSSNPYARRPDLPIPISTSATCDPLHASSQRLKIAAPRWLLVIPSDADLEKGTGPGQLGMTGARSFNQPKAMIVLVPVSVGTALGVRVAAVALGRDRARDRRRLAVVLGLRVRVPM